MRKEKLAAICDYLAALFPGCIIEQSQDLERGAQSFKVHVTDGTLLLKVGDEFINDTGTSEILPFFNRWGLSEILAKEKEVGVLVTHRGIERFRRI